MKKARFNESDTVTVDEGSIGGVIGKELLSVRADRRQAEVEFINRENRKLRERAKSLGIREGRDIRTFIEGYWARLGAEFFMDIGGDYAEQRLLLNHG